MAFSSYYSYSYKASHTGTLVEPNTDGSIVNKALYSRIYTKNTLSAFKNKKPHDQQPVLVSFEAWCWSRMLLLLSCCCCCFSDSRAPIGKESKHNRTRSSSSDVSFSRCCLQV